MTRLHFTKPHRLTKLHDELIAAGLTPERVEGTPDGSEAWITVADNIDPAAVTAIVAAHNPTPPAPPPDPDIELAAAITAATTLDALKAALLAPLPTQPTSVKG